MWCHRQLAGLVFVLMMFDLGVEVPSHLRHRLKLEAVGTHDGQVDGDNKKGEREGEQSRTKKVKPTGSPEQ